VTLPIPIVTQNRWTLLLGCSLCSLVLGASAVHAQDITVNTENQMAGVAPRLELEAGINFLEGFGGACRVNTVNGKQVQHCANATATVGGQMAALLRPWNHLAFGPAFGYGIRVGKDRLTLDDPNDPSTQITANYNRHMWRLALEARWYQRRVAVGGLFVGFQLGVTWFTDTLKLTSGSESSATQTAPIIGLSVGGSFLPYRGLGMSLAVQGYVSFLPTDGATLTTAQKSYGYGSYAFIGLTVNFATSVPL
jgi:hypothetical protein